MNKSTLMLVINYCLICGTIVFNSSVSIASPASGEWVGFLKTNSYIECGYSTEKIPFSMQVNDGRFTVVTHDAGGPLSFKGTIKGSEINEVIFLTIETPVTKIKVKGSFKGEFIDYNTFSGFMRGIYYKTNENEEGAFCESKVKLAAKNEKAVIHHEKKETVSESLRSVNKLLQNGLITQTEFQRMKDEIEKREKNKVLYDAIKKIELLLQDGLINKAEFSEIKKTLIKKHLNIK